MVEVEVHIPARLPPASISQIVEQACSAEGLALTMKGTLAEYPGCIHWHFKKGKQRGVLEITWWEWENRLWFKVAAGRTREWVEGAMYRLQEQIEHAKSSR